MRAPDFIARLKYRTTEEGGRRTPAHSKYRPAVKFPFSEMMTSGQQIFLDKDEVYPGDTVTAEITILSPDLFLNQLDEGQEFDFREGSVIIGTGEILEVVNEKLKKTTANKS
jgi:elongation factor Tu